MRLDATMGKGRSIFTSVCPGVSWTFLALCQRAGLKKEEKKEKILSYTAKRRRVKVLHVANMLSLPIQLLSLTINYEHTAVSSSSLMQLTCSSAPRLPVQYGCCSRGWWFAPFLCVWGHQSSLWLCWWCGCQWAWLPAAWWCSGCQLWWMTALCSVGQKKKTLKLKNWFCTFFF